METSTNRRTEQRKCDFPEGIPTAGAVDMSSLIHTGGNGGQTGNEDNDKVADILPEIHNHGGNTNHDIIGQPAVIDTGGIQNHIGPLISKSPGDQK